MKAKYIILGLLITLVSCQREGMDTTVTHPPEIKPPQITTNGSVNGFIGDNDGLPIVDATVQIGTPTINIATTSTDVNGNFAFFDIDLYEDGTTIKVDKEGYFDGSKIFNAIPNSTANLELQLQEEKYIESFNTQNGGRVALENAYVDFPQGTYEKIDGSTYDGDLDAFVDWLDPTFEEFYYQSPGKLEGLTIDRELKSLNAFGTIIINLSGSNDKIKNIPANTTATLNFPIPETLLQFAPETISLWYFDDNNGIWLEEGSAILVDGTYQAEVSRLSHWTVGVPFEGVTIDGKVFLDNQILTDTKVRIHDNNTFSRLANTTLSGAYTFSAPADTPLFLDIAHNCNSTSQSFSLGSFTSNKSIDDIEIELGLDNVTLKTNVTQCGSIQPPEDGFVILRYGNEGRLLRTENSGAFEYSFRECSESEMKLIAVDNAFIEASEVQTVQVHASKIANDLGRIEMCEVLPLSFFVDYDGMNWSNELEDTAIETWTISKISGATERTIINVMIMDPETQVVFMRGDFIIEDGSDELDYIVNLDTQGLQVTGKATVSTESYGPIKSHFLNVSDTAGSYDFDVTNTSIAPTSVDNFVIGLTLYE